MLLDPQLLFGARLCYFPCTFAEVEAAALAQRVSLSLLQQRSCFCWCYSYLCCCCFCWCCCCCSLVRLLNEICGTIGTLVLLAVKEGSFSNKWKWNNIQQMYLGVCLFVCASHLTAGYRRMLFTFSLNIIHIIGMTINITIEESELNLFYEIRIIWVWLDHILT